MTAESGGGFFRTPGVNFGEHRRAVALAYNTKAIDQLRRNNPPSTKASKKALTAYLREAGAIYLDQKARIAKERKAMPDTNAKRRHKAQLQRLAKSARQLKLKLMQLEKPASDLLWLPISDPITELMSANVHYFGDELLTNKGGTSLPTFLLNREHLHQALRAIEILATDAAGSLAPEKGGRPDHPGLAQWAENMRRLWIGTMGQTFTVVDGEHGASPAVDFFGDAMKALDPSIERGTLVSVMREVRQRASDEKTPQGSLGVTPNNA